MMLGSTRLGGPRTGVSALELKWWPFDSAVWLVAVAGATWVRYDFATVPNALDVLLFALGAVLANTLVGLGVGVYLRRFVPRHGAGGVG